MRTTYHAANCDKHPNHTDECGPVLPFEFYIKATEIIGRWNPMECARYKWQARVIDLAHKLAGPDDPTNELYGDEMRIAETGEVEMFYKYDSKGWRRYEGHTKSGRLVVMYFEKFEGTPKPSIKVITTIETVKSSVRQASLFETHPCAEEKV